MIPKSSCRIALDVFAGPGGLGEGFAALRLGQNRAFKIALSIEMDDVAHRTLELRAFFRQFPDLDDVPDTYYQFLRNPHRTEVDRRRLLDCEAGIQARREAWKATLGVEPLANVRNRIEAALPAGDAPWVRLGGPPCQAYSMVGRARNRGRPGYRLEDDPKHGLYKHYLQIIAEYRPAVFVMENVKGLLSARANGESIFHRMVEDLQHPAQAIKNAGGTLVHDKDDRYRICSLVVPPHAAKSYEIRDFVIHAENFGIPQSRHRVILLGVRQDYAYRQYRVLQPSPMVTIERVLQDLPRIRSGISRGKDSDSNWRTALQRITSERWFADLEIRNPSVADSISRELQTL